VKKIADNVDEAGTPSAVLLDEVLSYVKALSDGVKSTRASL